ncbi:MAG: hypothetical protein HYS21_11410 [Deltaproteobacteria bacterium]|nr:hypothetical protein [Deltaproteobacteria bacterium]
MERALRYFIVKNKEINIALMLSAALLSIWLVKIWTDNISIDSLKEGVSARHLKDPGVKALPAVTYYNVISERDLFRPQRVKLEAKPKPIQKPVIAFVPPPPAPPPPPRLTLVGTVLLDTGTAAIMENMGTSRGPIYYRVGDQVEGYVIKKIYKDIVLLEKGTEVLRVAMSHSGQGTQRQVNTAPVANRPPSDIPAGLIPRPPSQGPASNIRTQPQAVRR